MTELKNINRQFYEKNTCACCGINGSVKKYNFVFKYSYSAKLCAPCIKSLGGSALALQWLEENAIFDKDGKLIDFCSSTKSSSDIPLKENGQNETNSNNDQRTKNSFGHGNGINSIPKVRANEINPHEYLSSEIAQEIFRLKERISNAIKKQDIEEIKLCATELSILSFQIITCAKSIGKDKNEFKNELDTIERLIKILGVEQ